MSAEQPFNPKYGSTQTLTANSSSQSATIDEAKSCKQVRIVNPSAGALAYIRIGSGTQTAAATDLPIEAGNIVTVTKAQDHDTIGYISASGTTLRVTLGEGW